MLAVGEFIWGEVDPMLQRAATPFHGGVAGTKAELCGAFAAGLMLIGAQTGRTEAAVDRSPCTRLAAAYRDAFLQRWGTTQCSALREGGYGGSGLPCSALVAEAVGLLQGVLAEADAADPPA